MNWFHKIMTIEHNVSELFLKYHNIPLYLHDFLSKFSELEQQKVISDLAIGKINKRADGYTEVKTSFATDFNTYNNASSFFISYFPKIDNFDTLRIKQDDLGSITNYEDVGSFDYRFKKIELINSKDKLLFQIFLYRGKNPHDTKYDLENRRETWYQNTQTGEINSR